MRVACERQSFPGRARRNSHSKSIGKRLEERIKDDTKQGADSNFNHLTPCQTLKTRGQERLACDPAPPRVRA